MISESSLYYDGFGNYDFPKNCEEKKTLQEVKKIKEKNCVLKWTANQIFTITSFVVMIQQKNLFQWSPLRKKKMAPLEN